LRPRFGKKLLNEIRRDDIKELINDLINRDLSRSTIRNAICVIRGLFNYAIEEGLVDSNPAARLGRFTRSARTPETKGTALTPIEVKQFLKAAQEICPEYYPLFLMAVRAGLRRGELVAVQWGDVQLGGDENDAERFILVQHNYVHREHTTTKSKKSRRVDLSRELRKTLGELRDKRLLEAYLKGKSDISDELVFRSPDGTILDLDNLYHRIFLPVLAKAGIRRIRLHDSAIRSDRFSCKMARRLSTSKNRWDTARIGNSGHLRLPDSQGQPVFRGQNSMGSWQKRQIQVRNNPQVPRNKAK